MWIEIRYVLEVGFVKEEGVELVDVVFVVGK